MGKFKKFETGEVFERLTVVKDLGMMVKDGTKSRGHYIKCICSCDEHNEIIVKSRSLITGATKSCGCLLRETAKITSSKKFKKYNKYDLETYNYGVGWTSNTNKEFYFDKEDYDKIKNYCWSETVNGYLEAYDTIEKHNVFMHQVIVGKYVDHIHGRDSRNDNRKQNLRLPDDKYSFETYNNMNKSLQSNNKSGVTGVYWNKKRNKWIAEIGINNKNIRIGYFDKFNDAVDARKKAENKYFGEWSYDHSQKL